MEAEENGSRRAASKSALILSLGYVIISGLWILLSDAAVDALFPVEQFRLVHTLKGWLFVAVSGLLIYLVSLKFNLELLRSRALERWVHYDPVTGVPNRHLFLTLLETALEDAKTYKGRVGVVVIRLNELDKLSQAVGADISDDVAVTAVERIRACLRPNDRMARLGARTFTIMMVEPFTPAQVMTLSQCILSSLSMPVKMNADLEEVTVRPAAGVGVFPDNGDTAQRLLHAAEMAVLKAGHESGYRNIEFYSSRFSEVAADRIRLELRLKQAIETEAFEVHYQPQIDLSTRRIVGAEALIRWHDPGQGEIPPEMFIPFAEETDQISRISDFVIRRVVNMLDQLKTKGLKPVTVSVNISGMEIAGGDIDRHVQSIIDQRAVDPKLLELEITETAAMEDPEATGRVLQFLRSFGIGVALDDFATGYSSLKHLQRFKLDKLKIDKAFVRGIPGNQGNVGICQAIIAIAKTLGMQVVAEGVETEEAARALQSYGCNLAQGYLFSPPIPLAEFERLLSNGVSA